MRDPEFVDLSFVCGKMVQLMILTASIFFSFSFVFKRGKNSEILLELKMVLSWGVK